MREMQCLTLRKSTRSAAGWFGAQFEPVHKPSPRSGVSAERRWLLFPRIAALCRDAATPGLMASIHVQFLEVFPHHEACLLILSFSPGGGEGAWRAVEWLHAKRPRLFRSAAGPRSQRP